MRVVRRIMVVGVNSPQSEDPTRALWTQPPGCTGSRLWRMAAERTGITEEEWLAMTDRVNLCTGEWDRDLAMRKGQELGEEIRDRVTILLGGDVARCMPTTRARVMQWGQPGGTPRQDAPPWIVIPHPSGLCRWYNDPVNRISVEILLGDLIHMCTEDEESEDEVRGDSQGYPTAGVSRGSQGLLL